MKNSQFISKALQGLIWLCLGVVLLSPLYVNTELFFPYIVTKALAFNIAVEIMVGAYLALCLFDTRYRLRVTSVVGLLAAYCLVIIIASLLGPDFYHSFWSNHERSEGILLLLHLLGLSVVLAGFIQSMKQWLITLDIFVGTSVVVGLVALHQWLEQLGAVSAIYKILYPVLHAALSIVGTIANGIIRIPMINLTLPSSSGWRLDSTIGNAGYVAGFLLFGIFFALILMVRRRNLYARVAYGVVAVLQTFVLLLTGTRGGYIALAAAVAILLPYGLFILLMRLWRNHRQALWVTAATYLVLVILAVGGVKALIVYKDAPLVSNITILSRVSSISLSEATAQNRFMVWKIAIEGIKERPILGWGYENFLIPFNKYYTPELLEPWFDRSHNMVFDRLITGGIIGLALYVAFLLVPFILLWRGYWAKRETLNDRWMILPTLLSIMLLAYIIQNLLIFEALVTYIPLVLTLSLAAALNARYRLVPLPNMSPTVVYVASGVIAVAVAGLIYVVNVGPVRANQEFIQAVGNQSLTMTQRRQLFEQLLGRNTYGRPEFRQQLYTFFYNAAVRGAIPANEVSTWVQLVERELTAEVTENPSDLRMYLGLMDFYNVTGSGNIERLQRNVAIHEQIKSLSPRRPEIYYSLGYSYLIMSEVAKEAGQAAEAGGYQQQSIDTFVTALELNPRRYESYRHLLYMLAYLGRTELAMQYLRAAVAQVPELDRAALVSFLISTADAQKHAELAGQLRTYASSTAP